MKVSWLILSATFAVLIASLTDAYAGRVVTLYLDGAQIEQRETARKGYLEFNLPPTAQQDSLRITPGKGVDILRVVTAGLKPAKSVEKELVQLAEREELLHDRLKALSVREEIFRSAAKSQSAKAPRRTKSNPEPLSTIKQGTDYAITQLESVYHSKRKTEKELAQIAERRLLLGKNEQSGGNVAKVWITPATGSVTATWIQPDRYWLPVYQLRINDKGKAVITLLSQGVTLLKGDSAVLSLSQLQSAGKAVKFNFKGDWSILMNADIEVTKLLDTSPLSSAVTIGLTNSSTNSSTLNLPPGDISCFKSGVYIGKGRFEGLEIGKTTEVVCGSK